MYVEGLLTTFVTLMTQPRRYNMSTETLTEWLRFDSNQKPIDHNSLPTEAYTCAENVGPLILVTWGKRTKMRNRGRSGSRFASLKNLYDRVSPRVRAPYGRRPPGRAARTRRRHAHACPPRLCLIDVLFGIVFN
ncbi:hypothetical protein EVAR_47626_1 [Eumeta japonica]|uniref:Uncharacterized protein n=1 Tax=Eumeta variegata TaxID=151549 RepID=A0A4C1ZBT5_EUMVA|nr:hypothetical protein EVAR_47626_1 [Eumeta japonica]